MINCKMCRNINCWLAGEDYHVEECEDHVKTTNADRIRSMTDENLAEELYWLRLEALCLEGFDGQIETREEILDWLQEEVKE